MTTHTDQLCQAATPLLMPPRTLVLGWVFLHLPYLRSHWVMGLPDQLPPPSPAAERGRLVTGSWWLQDLYAFPFPLRSPRTAALGAVPWLFRCLQSALPSILLWFSICTFLSLWLWSSSLLSFAVPCNCLAFPRSFKEHKTSAGTYWHFNPILV